NKIVVALSMFIFIRIIFERYNIKAHLIEFFELEVLHDSHVPEVLVQVLSFIQTPDVVDPCIKYLFVSGKSLQVSSKLPVFFNHAYTVTFPAQDHATFQTAKSGPDYHKIILFHFL